MAAVTTGALGLSAAAEVSETIPETATLEVYCPTNDDPDFPFELDINVYENSIRYITVDKPVYGFERFLDRDALEFDANFSLKDEYNCFDHYSLEIYSADYSTKIFDMHEESGGVISVPDLSIAEGYKFSMMLESKTQKASYGGQFILQVELDSSISIDLFYQLSNMEGDVNYYASEYYENDSKNNNYNTPDILLHDKVMNGTVKSGDTDYFMYSSGNKVSDDDPEEDDRTGVANLQFSINITGLPSGKKVYLDLFDQNGKIIGSFESGAGTIFCRMSNLMISEIYKIKLTTTSNSSISYKLTPTYEFALAWYGQYVSKDIDGMYWNSAPIEKLSIKYGSETKPLFKENSSFSGDEAWMTQSCGIVGAAMILRNIYAKANIYDFRTGKSADILADPYTATLANCNYSINSNATTYAVTNGNNPRALAESDLSRAFGVKHIRKNGTISEANLKQMIKDYGYVLVYFNESHFMVLTDIASGTGTFAERATVYDPAAITYSAGANTLLSKTKTNYNNKSVNDITRVYAFYY